MTVNRMLHNSYWYSEQSCDLYEQGQFSCAYMSKQKRYGIGISRE